VQFSLPMIAWDCVLKKSGVQLEHIRDPIMHFFFEQNIRGGLVNVGSHKSAQANNPYLGDLYDPEQPTSYIAYVDANNLYG
jgi:hypothetical protein